MAKFSRSVETLVQSIRESLAEIGKESPLSLAHWAEADADAGYILHADGRMVGLGEYQYGFSHVDELLSPDLSEEVRKYARSEAGFIAGSIEAIDPNDINDPFELRERLSSVFQADSSVVEKAVREGKATIPELFELLASQKGKLVFQGDAGNKEFQVATDILVCRIKQNDDGALVRETEVAIKAGESVKGFAEAGRYAYANVDGGYVHLTADEFVAPEPRKRHHCKLHP